MSIDDLVPGVVCSYKNKNNDERCKCCLHSKIHKINQFIDCTKLPCPRMFTKIYCEYYNTFDDILSKAIPGINNE